METILNSLAFGGSIMILILLTMWAIFNLSGTTAEVRSSLYFFSGISAILVFSTQHYLVSSVNKFDILEMLGTTVVITVPLASASIMTYAIGYLLYKSNKDSRYGKEVLDILYGYISLENPSKFLYRAKTVTTSSRIIDDALDKNHNGLMQGTLTNYSVYYFIIMIITDEIVSRDYTSYNIVKDKGLLKQSVNTLNLAAEEFALNDLNRDEAFKVLSEKALIELTSSLSNRTLKRHKDSLEGLMDHQGEIEPLREILNKL